MTKYITVSSPIGKVYINADGSCITGLWIEGQAHFPDLSQEWECFSEPILLEAANWIEAYFSGKKPDPSRLPLSPCGTRFQKSVWEQLKTIPYGETVSYGQIAKAIGKPGAFQAVGNAVGRNPISIIIPCHRVVGKNGELMGYASGLDAKRYLLEMEQKSK